jgi:spore maturation protein CgeB
MPTNFPDRVLIVSYGPNPPLAESMAAAWKNLGSDTAIFHSWLCNTRFDRFLIHPINHYARVLRLVPKNTNLFEGHPKSHKEWRSRQLLNLALEFKPDLLIITGIQRFKLDILEKLSALTTVFYWFTEAETRFQEIVPDLPYYHQIYFFATAALSRAQDLGYKNLGFLPPAVDTNRFRPLAETLRYDWCFVGQWHQRRQVYVAALAEVSKNFVIYGSRWRKHTWRQPEIFLRVKGRGIWGDDVVRLYNQTRVVINISVWGSGSQGGTGANSRLVEVPACRACLLSDYNPDAELLLEPGKDFVGAQNLQEMQASLQELLGNPQKRQQIAASGYQKAKTVWSYNDLVAQLAADWRARRS